MNHGVGVSRAERRELLLERISETKTLILAHTELADLIENAEARSVAHHQVWGKVARRLRQDAAELGRELLKAEQRLFDISTAQQASDNHMSTMAPRIKELRDS